MKRRQGTGPRATSRPRVTREAGLPSALQQVERTYVLDQGTRRSYFAGCDYFRLASHPAVQQAARDGLTRFGLNVAASRKTTGNHRLYEELERELARFFGVPAAVLFPSGYVANLGAAQGLAGGFTHALIDERAHSSLVDAASLLGCGVVRFRHRDARAAAAAARRCGRGARLLLMTDGLFAHSGEVAPLRDYLQLLPRSAWLLVDDAHGAGLLGRRGRGTIEHLGIEPRRVIQTITMSKAFGAYGGAVLGPAWLARNIIGGSRLFAGHTPLPPPLVMASLAALRLLRKEPGLRRRLVINAGYVKAALREAGFRISDGPAPIVAIRPTDPSVAARVCRRLRAAGIHPPLIRYGEGTDAYFRFVISSEHTGPQLDALVDALTRGDGLSKATPAAPQSSVR